MGGVVGAGPGETLNEATGELSLRLIAVKEKVQTVELVPRKHMGDASPMSVWF